VKKEWSEWTEKEIGRDERNESGQEKRKWKKGRQAVRWRGRGDGAGRKEVGGKLKEGGGREKRGEGGTREARVKD